MHWGVDLIRGALHVTESFPPSRAAALVVGAGLGSAGLTACSTRRHKPGRSPGTPIQTLVVIYQENVSFDHSFGSYPVAANSSGSQFSARHWT
jgi:phospholipase C